MIMKTQHSTSRDPLPRPHSKNKLASRSKARESRVGRRKLKRKKLVNQDEAEGIAAAAIRLTDGSVFSGCAHYDALEKAEAKHSNASENTYAKLFANSIHGFLTTRGRFVRRGAAYRIALKSHQIRPKGYTNAWHDMWGFHRNSPNWLEAVSFSNSRRDR
jgi:hypothetical protein